jgi:hypothetical protein
MFVLQNQSFLNYTISYGEDQFDCAVEVVNRRPYALLNYTCSNAKNSTGQINISVDALQSAKEQDHQLEGEKEDYINKTAFWVSTDVFDSLKLGLVVEMPYRQGFMLNNFRYKLIENRDVFVNVNDKDEVFSCLYVEDVGGMGFQYCIWDNRNEPLILRMKTTLELTLNQVQVTEKK